MFSRTNASADVSNSLRPDPDVRRSLGPQYHTGAYALDCYAAGERGYAAIVNGQLLASATFGFASLPNASVPHLTPSLRITCSQAVFSLDR
jgi:hypothetical protein